MTINNSNSDKFHNYNDDPLFTVNVIIIIINIIIIIIQFNHYE